MKGAAWVVLALAGCTGAEGSAIATVDTLPGGVVRVTNHTALAPTWRLEPVRQLGDVPGRELQAPAEFVVSGDGRVYVLDDGPPVIRVFAADGRELSSIGREGTGPGEFRGGGMLLLSRDTLVHQDQRQSRAQAFTLDGELVGQWSSPCCVRLPVLADLQGRFPMPGDVGRVPPGGGDMGAGMGYQRFRADGSIADTVDFPPSPRPPFWRASDGQSNWNWVVPFASRVDHILDRQGRMIWGDQRGGTFVISSTGRDTLRLFVAEEERPAIPEPARQAAVDDVIAANAAFRGVARLDEVPSTYPSWSGLMVDDVNRAWVLRPGPTGPTDHWHVFDPDGRLLATVAASGVDAEQVRIAGDHLYAITPDSTTGFDVIRVYAIRR